MNVHLNKGLRAVVAGSSLRIGVVALLLGALTPSAGPPLAAVTGGSCQPTKAKFTNEPNLRSTNSISFANMPGTMVNFIQGGASKSCVIVYFSADVRTDTQDRMLLLAKLDDAVFPNPNSREFISFSPTTFNSHTASFIFTGVAPGAHTVRIQWRANNGQGVSVMGSNTIVHHVP